MLLFSTSSLSLSLFYFLASVSLSFSVVTRPLLIERHVPGYLDGLVVGSVSNCLAKVTEDNSHTAAG